MTIKVRLSCQLYQLLLCNTNRLGFFFLSFGGGVGEGGNIPANEYIRGVRDCASLITKFKS